VPKFVGKYTHGVKQHEQRLKRVIDKLRDDEKAEVKEEMDDQDSRCSKCGKDPCVCGMEKSSRKKKKWPSFDVQSHQIAKREGVSEKDADAMLASRARNHGAKKSLANMSLVDIYHSKIKKAQSVLSTPKARISASDVDGEGHLSDAAELRTASSDQGRWAESRMARRSTMKPNNIREVNRRQIDRDISRPGSRANIAHGRKVKSDEQASGMKTKGDLPTPVPPDPDRGGKVRKSELSKKKLQKFDISDAAGAVQDVVDNYDTLKRVKDGTHHLANMFNGKLDDVQKDNDYTNWGITVGNHPNRAQQKNIPLPRGYNTLRRFTNAVRDVTADGSISGPARRFANKVVSTITGKRP
jgi:hypothetical protein